MILNCQTKNEVKRSSRYRDVLYGKIKQSDWLRELWGQNSRTRMLNYLRWQFAFSLNAYPHAENQHHISSHS